MECDYKKDGNCAQALDVEPVIAARGVGQLLDATGSIPEGRELLASRGVVDESGASAGSGRVVSVPAYLGAGDGAS